MKILVTTNETEKAMNIFEEKIESLRGALWSLDDIRDSISFMVYFCDCDLRNNILNIIMSIMDTNKASFKEMMDSSTTMIGFIEEAGESKRSRTIRLKKAYMHYMHETIDKMVVESFFEAMGRDGVPVSAFSGNDFVNAPNYINYIEYAARTTERDLHYCGCDCREW